MERAHHCKCMSKSLLWISNLIYETKLYSSTVSSKLLLFLLQGKCIDVEKYKFACCHFVFVCSTIFSFFFLPSPPTSLKIHSMWHLLQPLQGIRLLTYPQNLHSGVFNSFFYFKKKQYSCRKKGKRNYLKTVESQKRFH